MLITSQAVHVLKLGQVGYRQTVLTCLLTRSRYAVAADGL